MNGKPIKGNEAFFDDEYYLDDLSLYMQLTFQPELTEEEGDRLEEILCKAESDEFLTYWLSVIDNISNQELSLLDEKHIKSYKNQQAWLREYLISQKLEERTIHLQLQKRLKDGGCYHGPQDGVFGEDSRKAIEKYEQQHDLDVSSKDRPKTLISLAKTPKDVQKFFSSLGETFDSQDGGQFNV